MKKTLTALLAGSLALAFSSCTTVVHPTETRTVYRTVTPAKKKTYRPAYVAPARSYDTPESTTVVRPAE